MEDNVPNSCPGPDTECAGKASTCQGCPNQKLCSSGVQSQIDPACEEIKNRLSYIRHKIAVMSCKGGVGKTSLSVQLARSIAKDPSVNVGLLDTDITGPSLPVMLDLQGHQIHKSSSGWIPVYVDENLAVMSVSFLLDSRDTAVIWRGPKKNELIKKFLLDVDWAETEYLIVDTPPGTTDEHFALQEYLNKTVELDGAVLVTTPHESSQDGLRKIINLCRKFDITIVGVVENMATFCCPKCEATSKLFGPLGITEEICTELSVDFLGSIPLDENFGQICEEGKPYYDLLETSSAAQLMDQIFKDIKNRVTKLKYGEEENEETSSSPPPPVKNSIKQQSIKKNEADSDTSNAVEEEISTACDEPTSIKNVVMVMSGKGGVGKTTTSVQIALALERKGFKVGLLDADVCGPSVATVLKIKGRNVYNSDQGWLPIRCGSNRNLAVMSTGFFMNDKNDAFIWRGPKKTGMINQFLNDVCWGALDYLVVDTPPGTSDEHLACLSAFKELNVAGAVLVTSPQGVSLADVRREVNYCQKTNTKVIGVLENLSGFTCPECSEVTNIFSKGGGEKLADHFKIPFLGCIPICSNPEAPMKEFDDIVDKF